MGRAARIGHEVPGHVCGVGPAHVDSVHRHAQHLGDDEADAGLRSATHVADAGGHMHPAFEVNPHQAVAVGATRVLLAVAQPDAASHASRLRRRILPVVPVNGLCHQRQALFAADLVKYDLVLDCERHQIARLLGILAAEFERVHADRSGHLIHVLLACEHRLRLAEAAELAADRAVGVDAVAVEPEVGAAIGIDDALSADAHHRRSAGGVTAGRLDRPALDRGDAAVTLHAGLHVDDERVARVLGVELLLQRVLVAHGLADFLRGKRGDGLVDRLAVGVEAFAAETAADVLAFDANVLRRHAQDVGQNAARMKYALLAVPQCQTIVGVTGNAHVRLDLRVRVHRRNVTAFDDDVGRLEPRGDVALFVLHRRHVARLRTTETGHRAARVDRGDVVGQVVFGVGKGLQLAPVDTKQIERFLRDVLVVGDDGGHRIADVARMPVHRLSIARRNLLVGQPWDVVPGHHPTVPGQGARARVVDRQQLGVRIGRAQDLQKERVLRFVIRMKAQVAGVACSAGGLFIAVDRRHLGIEVAELRAIVRGLGNLDRRRRGGAGKRRVHAGSCQARDIAGIGYSRRTDPACRRRQHGVDLVFVVAAAA